MNQKPEIQYIGQFYVYGSEARAEELKAQKAQSRLPLPKLKPVQKIYIDPVALCGLTVAVVMLVVLVVGAFQLRASWKEYNVVAYQLSELKKENDALEHSYRMSFDPEAVRTRAKGMGMIPVEDAETKTIRVTMPKPKAEPGMWDDVKWFLKGLFD